jgi:hypothetical protein
MAIPMKGKFARETFEDYNKLKKSKKDFEKGLKPPTKIPWTLIGAIIIILLFLFWGRF